jgi:hypothetical protein
MNAVAAKIEVGRRVIHHGPYGALQAGVIVAVRGEPGAQQDQRAGVMTFLNPNACSFEVVTFDGCRFESRESCIGRPGIGRIDLQDKVHGPRLIAVAEAAVIERQAREATDAAIAKQKYADAVERVRAENPNLIPIPAGQYGGAVHAAKNIRKELKAAGIKASVRSDRFAGGDSVDVRLPYGTTDEVMQAAEAIAKKYRGGHFNAMEDIYEYSNSPWCDVFGDAKYVSVQRDWAPAGGEA